MSWCSEFADQSCHFNMEKEHILDATQLEAPAPLEAALDALDNLPPGHYLRLILKRNPVFLYPLLLVQGYEHATHSHSQEHYEVLIWHKDDQDAAQAAHGNGCDN